MSMHTEEPWSVQYARACACVHMCVCVRVMQDVTQFGYPRDMVGNLDYVAPEVFRLSTPEHKELVKQGLATNTYDYKVDIWMVRTDNHVRTHLHMHACYTAYERRRTSILHASGAAQNARGRALYDPSSTETKHSPKDPRRVFVCVCVCVCVYTYRRVF